MLTICRPHSKNPTNSVITSLYDASSIAAPTNAPPTGTYALDLAGPQQTGSGCLTGVSQQVAWSCDLVPNSALSLVIGQPPNTQGSGAVIQYASYNSSITLGAQASYMNTTFAQFLTVQDEDNKGDGPAYYFQQFYDKVIVLPEGSLSATAAKAVRRDVEIEYGESLQQKRAVMSTGDQPWFCVFNDTLLEGFIYVDRNASTSTSILNSTTVSAATVTSTTSSATSSASGTDLRSVIEDGYWTGLAQFPFVVKLEERRVEGSPQPYCQQYQILEDGEANWIPGKDGQPIIVQLTESDSGYTGCQCQWMSGE